MSKATEVLNLLEEHEEHQLSSGLEGFSKDKAKNRVNGILADASKGIFKDDSWKSIMDLWKSLEYKNITPVIQDSKYDNESPPKFKTWKFEIYFMGNKGKEVKLSGVVTAHGAGSVQDPLSKYDISAYCS